MAGSSGEAPGEGCGACVTWVFSLSENGGPAEGFCAVPDSFLGLAVADAPRMVSAALASAGCVPPWVLCRVGSPRAQACLVAGLGPWISTRRGWFLRPEDSLAPPLAAPSDLTAAATLLASFPPAGGVAASFFIRQGALVAARRGDPAAAFGALASLGVGGRRPAAAAARAASAHSARLLLHACAPASEEPLPDLPSYSAVRFSF